MIARYTRPEIGALWTDAARLEYWRRVEVAACEEMDGPSAAELERIRAARASVEAVAERERVTDHDVAAFVDVLAADAGPAGRWIHHGLTSSDVLDTALALALRDAGEIVLAGARELVGVLVARRASTSRRSASGAPTACTPSRRRSASSSPASPSRRTATRERLGAGFDAVAVGAVSGAVGTYASTSPQFEERVLARLGLAASRSRRRSSPATATPSC